MQSYRVHPALIQQDGRTEEQLVSGSYGTRQIYELIQNGADAIQAARMVGRVSVVLTRDHLYCANEGQPITINGLQALLMASMSDKKGEEIGRFGLGFKSVLGVCDHPEFFSRYISIRFNPPELAEEMRCLVPPGSPLPKLRTAELLNLGHIADEDPMLAALLNWATTVVRLPLRVGVRERLLEDIRSFPSEMLVFSPHLATLHLHAANDGLSRSMSVASTGDECVTVTEGDQTTEWRRFTLRLQTSDLPTEVAANMDVSLRQRRTIPIIWAVPASDRQRRNGRFWAFFPTLNETTMQGVVNAPWKTDPDRENLSPGSFNAHLLEAAATLVAEKISTLNTDDDPSRFLDYLPARDDKGWADQILSENVINMLKDKCCLPTVGGNLRRPIYSWLRPVNIDQEMLQDWFTEFGRYEPAALGHPSLMKPERTARARRMGAHLHTPDRWLLEVVEGETPEHSIAAIHLADALLKAPLCTRETRRSLLDTAFVLTQGNDLAPPQKNELQFAAVGRDQVNRYARIVHPDVADHAGAKRILQETFGVQTIDDETELRGMVSLRYCDWADFWSIARRLRIEAAAEIISSAESTYIIHAKTRAGQWAPLSQLLLEGTVASPPLDSESQKAIVDHDYHRDDVPLMRILGLDGKPKATTSPDCWSVIYGVFYAQMVEQYLRECVNQKCSSTPQQDYIVLHVRKTVEPLDPLIHLKGNSAVLMSHAVYEAFRSECAAVNCFIRHSTRTPPYPNMPIPPPAMWALHHFGWVDTSVGPVRLTDAVGPGLNEYGDFLPVLTEPPGFAQGVTLPDTVNGIEDRHWEAALKRAEGYERDWRRLASFYALLALSGRSRPERLRARRGDGWCDSPPAEVTVTTDESSAQGALDEGRNVLRASCSAQADILIEKWGLIRCDAARIGWQPANESMLAVDRFAGLQSVTDFPRNVRIQPCEGLWHERGSAETGQRRQPIETAFRDGCLYFVGSRSDRWILTELLDRTSVNLMPQRVNAILGEASEECVNGLRKRVRAWPDIEHKVLECIGCNALVEKIPEEYVRLLKPEQRQDPTMIAKLACSVFGVEILKEYRDSLSSLGLRPPTHWAGGSQAVSFVTDLGFPRQYAGYPQQQRSPFDDVSGPSFLPPLHDFQHAIMETMIKCLESPTPRRGLLSLPTGAGKTRVAVETVIRWIRSRDRPASVLWIAQSDELCEQAVQTWLQAWRAIGPVQAHLRVNRLWGRTNNAVRPNELGSCIVVSSFQSLVNRIRATDFDWVFNATLIIIDEAHAALAPSYTEILKRLGLTHRETARPLIGLTATPFRGSREYGEEETRRLVQRFGFERFDTAHINQADLYKKLVEMKVLAKGETTTIPGADLNLTADELKYLDTFHEVPDSVGRRLAENMDRSQRIIEHLLRLPRDWPILLFATSVDHAEELAVRLTLEGVSAAAVSGQTSVGKRRHAIEEFRRGRLRVLTNYGVLTTGFDAPSVRVVYITRPVYSPVLYQQVIGRGLRGPLNGGKELCLIVNVDDNIRQFGHALAFHKFEHLWRPFSMP